MSPEKLDRINNVLNEITKLRLEEENESQVMSSKQQKGASYTMNAIQRYVLLLGIIAIAAIGLFPPWHKKHAESEHVFYESIGNYFILSAPNRYSAIDYITIFIEWATVILCVGGLILFFRKSN